MMRAVGFVFATTVALVGGLIVWLSLPKRDPLAGEYRFRDERSAPGSPSEESPTGAVDR